MKRFSFVLFVSVVALMGAGCQMTSAPAPSASTTGMNQMDHSGHQMDGMDMGSMPMVHDAKLASVGDVIFTPEVFSPGVLNISFKVNGNNGKAYRPEDLNVVHDKLIHVILVRKDMKVFRHEHPEFQKNGYWSFKTTINEPGEYYAYLDLSPKNDPAVVWYLPFAVRGKWTTSAPELTPELKTTVDGVQASLQLAKLVKAGEEATIDISLTKDGKAVEDIQPYLAAYGHLVTLQYKSPDVYLHNHPLTLTKPIDGHVKFATTFPEAGVYSLFPQFNIGGKIMTFPITIEVKETGVNAPGYGQGSMRDILPH